jgi:cytidylate kinase
VPVITISRTFGSGGSEIAEAVSRHLGWTLLDNAFVDRVAAGLHTTPAQVQALEERPPSLFERIADTLAYGSQELLSALLPSSALPPTEERLMDVTRRVIEEAAGRGPVVLVGRGAQMRLQDRTDALHVLCAAPRDAAAARIAAREGVSVEEACRRVDEVNAQRTQFIRRHYHREWLNPDAYHLCINTAWLGIDEAVRLILDQAARRGFTAAKRMEGLP